MSRVIGYARVSTQEQADSGAGLVAQIEAIKSECERRGLELVEVVEDAGFSAKNLKRPGIQRVMESLSVGEAQGLVVAKLDRLSRSLLDFASVMELARREGWALIALDLGVDTSTPSGEMMASVLATFAQFERRLIGQRTRDALAVRRAQGVRLGRPPAVTPETLELIRERRADGDTYQRIADYLNEVKVPTAQSGRQWHAGTVHRMLNSSASRT